MVYPIVETLALNSMSPIILKAQPDTAQPKQLQYLKTPSEVDLAFHNLTYSVKEKKGSDSKTILQNISGRFQPQCLTAIVGPSRADKSTLLHILSGYENENVEVEITTNGISQNFSVFRKISAYIGKEIQLHDNLNVEEAIRITIKLQLSEKLTPGEKDAMINDILQTVDLVEQKSTLTKNLSVDGKKRLSIALELVKNPSILFFDEPTFGLDFSTSFQFIQLLKTLAAGGRSIICTFHESAGRLFQMFDQIYVLTEGQCIYQGNTNQLVPFLRALDIDCPIYHDPAYFIIEVASGEHGEHINKLVNAIDNGKRDIRTESDFAYIRARNNLEELKNLNNELDKNDIEEVKPETSTKVDDLLIDVEEKEDVTKLKVITLPVEYPTSQFNQFLVVLKTTMLCSFRDRGLTYLRIFAHIFGGLLIGAVYFNIGNDGGKVLCNAGFLFFNVMFLMYTSMTVPILTLPQEIPVLLKENSNRRYSLRSFYLALTVSNISFQTILSIIYATIVYYMTSQPNEQFRYSMFLTVSVFTSLVAQSVGLLIGAAMDTKRGLFCAAVICVPLLLFSGFFASFEAMPRYLEWITYISYIRYGYEGSVVATYGFYRNKLPCSQLYCHFRNPEILLQEFGMQNSSFTVDIAVLVAFLILLRIGAYVLLSWKLKKARKEYKTL